MLKVGRRKRGFLCADRGTANLRASLYVMLVTFITSRSRVQAPCFRGHDGASMGGPGYRVQLHKRLDEATASLHMVILKSCSKEQKDDNG